jgi:hypothetical protein
MKFILLLCLMTASALSADLYVRPNGGSYGAENGSDWNNAFDGFGDVAWASLSPGDTLWVAGGTYTQELRPTKSGSPGAPIAFRRARMDSVACTGKAGWSSAFASTVLMQRAPITLIGDCDYITVSGRTTEAGGAHGWHINFKGATAGAGVEFINGADADFITVEYMDIEGPGPITYSSDGRGLDLTPFSGATDGFFSHLKIFDWESGVYVVGMNSVVFEHLEMFDIFAANWQAFHPNGIFTSTANNVIVRYSKFHKGPKGKGCGEGIFFEQSGGCSNWQIYGNLFYDIDEGGQKAIEVTSVVPNLKIWNNTFDNILAPLYVQAAAGAGTELKNNLFCASGSPSFGETSNNLAVSSGAVFINRAAKDYRIVSGTGSGLARNAGTPLVVNGSVNRDMNGNTRGLDGAWDIGALEFSDGTGVVDTTAPAVTLTAPVAGSNVTGTVSITANASDEVNGSGVDNVTFLVNGVAVGSDTTAPYSFSWNTLSIANGSLLVSARATDVAGNQATSPAVSVMIQHPLDTTPPTVSLTAPAANGTVVETLTITAAASDTGSGVASVTFSVDGNVLGSDTTQPYSLVWNTRTVANGAHSIRAVAQDNAGNQTSSSIVNVTVQNSALELLSGLIGYWDFNETEGAQAMDRSGNENSGTVVAGATWSAGKLAGGLSLNGQAGYIRVPSSAALEQVTDALTISAWVKLNQGGQMQSIVRKVLSETTNVAPYTAYDLVIQDFSGQFKPRIAISKADSSRAVAWGQSRTYGEWLFLVGVYDGTRIRMYVNAAEEASTPFSGPVLHTTQPLCIGRYGAVGETVNGIIDDVRVYNRALSATEIQTLFGGTPPRAPTGFRVSN